MIRDGFQARIHAMWHKITHQTHDVQWRYKPGKLCPGDITCETCNKIFWCRMLDLSDKELNERIKENSKKEE